MIQTIYDTSKGRDVIYFVKLSVQFSLLFIGLKNSQGYVGINISVLTSPWSTKITVIVMGLLELILWTNLIIKNKAV